VDVFGRQARRQRFSLLTANFVQGNIAMTLEASGTIPLGQPMSHQE
jgi:hypothetical protein